MHVDVKHRLAIRSARIEQGLYFGDSGVREYDVNSAVLGDDFLNHGLDSNVVGHIYSHQPFVSIEEYWRQNRESLFDGDHCSMRQGSDLGSDLPQTIPDDFLPIAWIS